MAKQGMKRPERTHTKPKNEQTPVPEIQGSAKSKKKRAAAIVAGSKPVKVYHSVPYSKKETKEKPISDAYSVIDNDLARDNLENDITAADLQDL